MADFYPGENPGYSFQQPAIQPKSYQSLNDFGPSLDSIMNHAIQRKVMGQEMQKNDIALNNIKAQSMLQYGGFGFTPQDVTQQRIQGAQNHQPGMDPQTQGIAAYLMMQKQMMGQQYAQSQAQTGLTLADMAAKQAAAAKDNIYVKMLGGTGPEGNVISGTIDQVQRGNLAPEGVFDASGRDSIVRLAMQQEMNRRGLNQQALQNTADASSTLAKSGAVPIANTQSLQSSLDVLDELNGSFQRSYPQFGNKLVMQGASAFKPNSVEGRMANAIQQQANIVSDLFQNNFGAGSNEKLALAKSLSDPKQSTQQLSDTIKLMRADMKNRISSFQGKQGDIKPDLGIVNKVPSITSKADYDNLPKGSQYNWNGKIGTKR